MDRAGDPGAWLIMQDSISSLVNAASSPRWVRRYHMKMFLKAFSLEQEPHIIVVIQSNPFGATFNNMLLSFAGQSAPGNTPRAGRLTKAFWKQI